MAIDHMLGHRAKNEPDFPQSREEWIERPSTKINALAALVRAHIARNNAYDAWVAAGSPPDDKPVRTPFTVHVDDGKYTTAVDDKNTPQTPRSRAPEKDKVVIYCHWQEITRIIQKVRAYLATTDLSPDDMTYSAWSLTA
jgi:hypothetical protein